uniref:Methylated-DNA--protein-cysteine methyltransferase n=1 Tax=Cyanistes caeruleus TaxID=156563 RepID=A0A8C0V9V1_CYACU
MYFDIARVFSSFPCFGAHPASHQRTLLLGSSTEELLALALFPAGWGKAARIRKPLDGPSVVVRALDVRRLLAGVAVLAISLGVVSILSHGCTADGLGVCCCPHTSLCSSQSSPPHPSLGKHQESTTTPFPSLLCTPENIQLGKRSCKSGVPFFITLIHTLLFQRKRKRKKRAWEEAHFYLQVLSVRSLCFSAPAKSSVACEVCEGGEEMPEPLQQCTAWLRAYFSEPETTGSLPLPAFHHPLLQRDSFTRQVLWTLLKDVKFGEAVSYKQLADLAGNSRAARAVGGAMRSNPIPIIIPCHRVILSSGDTGSYGGGHLLKEWLLSHEKLQKEKLARGGGR